MPNIFKKYRAQTFAKKYRITDVNIMKICIQGMPIFQTPSLYKFGGWVSSSGLPVFTYLSIFAYCQNLRDSTSMKSTFSKIHLGEIKGNSALLPSLATSPRAQQRARSAKRPGRSRADLTLLLHLAKSSRRTFFKTRHVFQNEERFSKRGTSFKTRYVFSLSIYIISIH